MKKGFMNKRCGDMTGWDLLKWAGVMVTALYGVVIALMAIAWNAGRIVDGVVSFKNKLIDKYIARHYNYVEDDCEEDEEL